MKQKPSRRKLLVTIGGATVPLAGCMGPSSSDDTESPTDETDTETPSDTDTPADTDTETETEAPEPEFTRGEVLADFESLDEWGVIAGEMSADTDTAYAGSQSVLVEREGDSAGIFKTFPDGLNLMENDLSVAMQLENPAEGKLAVDIFAPGGRNHAIARRWLPEELDDWVRFDIGYTNESGKPEMTDVNELRFVVHPVDGSDVKFRLDDLRLMPKQNERGKVMLTFDDNHKSHYEFAYEEMKKRDMAGVSATIPSAVGDVGHTSIGELREMQGDGWDIVSHPQEMNPSTPLPEMSEEDQRKIIKETKEWLELKGFSKGAKYFVTPFDQMGDETLDIVQEHHEMGFLFGACNNAAPPSGRHNVSRVYGISDDIQAAQKQIKLASRRDQMAVLAFHDIGPDAEINKEDFTSLLDTIEEHDVDVVTASDVEEMY